MRRTMSLLLTLALAVGLLAGCGANSGGTAAAPETAYDSTMDYSTGSESGDAGLSGTDADRLTPHDGRNIIYNASLEMDT